MTTSDDHGSRTTLRQRWRRWYERSPAQDVVVGLARVDFGNRIILFGAALLLSVLPLIIILSAFAGRRIDGDITRHLGLSRDGQEIVRGMFRPTATSLNLAVILSLLLSFAGSIAVAASVQQTYEQTYALEHRRGPQALLRCVAWVFALGALLIADGAAAGPVRNAPFGTFLLGVTDFGLLVAFVWWSMHLLLAGRVSWRALIPPAIATSVFWVGLGALSELYFSSALVSDSRLYGTIGVVFTLVTWFIAIGAVIVLGAVTGEVVGDRRERRHSATRSERQTL
jgi:membrane protein